MSRSKFMRIVKIQNPFLLFSPFLLFYIVMVFIFPTNGMTGDENRYLMFGGNLVHGFYSPSTHNIDIGEGPGYPILLMPLLASRLPLVCITLVNAVLYYLSIILLFKALQKIVSFPIVLICSLFWACYYNSYENMILIHPETFTAFLISLLVFSLMMAFDPVKTKKTNVYVYFSGFIFGYIVLTKVIFGYVLACMFIGLGLLWIMNRKNENYRKAITILLIAFTTTAPYLIYTYHLTDKIFYWSTSGGNNLYWMSTPFEGEYGDWMPNPKSVSSASHIDDHRIVGYENYIEANHGKDFREIYKFNNAVERDDAFKRIAVNNIKSHPVKYIKNCISNIGRMLFNNPYSYTLQKNSTLLRLPLNGVLVVLTIFCALPTFFNWRNLNFPIQFMLFMALIYFGGSIFVSGETRMFTQIVPILLFWIGLVIQKTIKINSMW
jgi:4-amino-4-deoxy-L-arabinose transferase-like glycosyltransferase